jgi:hypothetical protein
MGTRLRSILIIAFALLPGAFGDKKPKVPEVSVIQFTAHRSGDLVLVDGTSGRREAAKGFLDQDVIHN